ncbi:hypothetical protein [Micromonospora sp. HK10]|uniref:hypothetical protein n=1 Tax=Micromonospora sp. HK10 TaxID=1538294 RepID=UPI0012E15284|nr:hypothetical protein [Micromonospora sp. HK10]
MANNTEEPASAEGAGQRKSISPAMLAALWTVSNGRCYAPGCPFPVVYEVRPGHFQKNAQVAHIYGVRPGAPRYRPDMPASMRDSFENLLLLCQAHHEEVDGKDSAHLYPVDVLRRWKIEHEGDHGSVLKDLRVVNTGALMNALIKLAEPPLSRLERITKQLEQTGTVTADTVRELKAITAVLSASSGLDSEAVRGMVRLANALEDSRFGSTAARLSEMLEVQFPHDVARLEEILIRIDRYE